MKINCKLKYFDTGRIISFIKLKPKNCAQFRTQVIDGTYLLLFQGKDVNRQTSYKKMVLYKKFF